MARLAETSTALKLGFLPTAFAIVAALYFAQEVFIPLAVAVLLTFLLAPAVTWLERRGMRGVLAVLLVVATALGVLGTITWTVQRQFVEVAGKLPDYQDNIRNKLERFRGATGGRFSKAVRGVEETVKSVAGSQPSPRPPVPAESVSAAQGSESRPGTLPPGVPALPPVSPQNPLPVREYSEPSSPPQIVGHYLGQLLSPLATVGLIVIFVIFMLLTRNDLRDRMIRLVGHGRLNVTTQALDDAATRISHYLLTQLAINTIYGISVGLGLWIIGLCSAEGHFPNVLLWALLATVLRFVPYAGPIMGAALPVVLSLAVFRGVGVFVATVSMYVVLELVTSNVLEPWLYGSSTGLSIVAILASVVFWTWLWGPVGLLLATPLTVCLVVLGKYVPQLEFLDVILGDEQVLELPVRVYQRLLSLDQEDASDLLHAYRDEKGLQSVYDDVLIPALAMAERDRHTGTLGNESEVFIRQAMRDFIEELGDAQKKQNAATALGGESSSAVPIVSTPTAADSTVMVLCLPAQDEADEIVGLMLAQLLELEGQRAVAVSQVSLTGEVVELVAEHKPAAVCISSLPPAALAHSRYLCKRLSSRFPELHTVVGLWTSKADPKKSLGRFSCGAPSSLVTNLAGAIAEIRQIVRPLAFQRANASEDAEAKPEPDSLPLKSGHS